MPKPKRCSYTEGRSRCPRNGTVQVNERAWICRAHLLLLREQNQRASSPLGGIIGDVIAGRKLNGDDISAALDGLFGAIFGQQQQATIDGQPVVPPPQARARPIDPAVEQKRLEREERNRRLAILGFPPNTKPTKDQIKKRVRELAMHHHPDRGGSVERMAQINDAADRLSA